MNLCLSIDIFMWLFIFIWCGTFFKVFIEFVIILLLFFMFCFFWPRGTWYLSSLTRDWTRIPCIGRQSLNHWTAREITMWFLVKWLTSTSFYKNTIVLDNSVVEHLDFLFFLAMINNDVMNSLVARSLFISIHALSRFHQWYFTLKGIHTSKAFDTTAKLVSRRVIDYINLYSNSTF